jgi:hypothetical protein
LSLSFQLWQPKINPASPLYTPRGTFLGEITNQVEDYSQVLTPIHGMKSAGLTIKVNQFKAEEWIEEGLGRHVEVIADVGGLRFAGLVNKLTWTLGGFTVVRGPLTQVVNSVVVAYGRTDLNTGTTTGGETTFTPAAEDTDSQARYGRLETIINAGDREVPTAAQIRDTYLEDHKDPQTDKSLAIGATGSADSVLTLELLGYWQFMTRYTYTNASVGTTNPSAKIDDVLAGDPLGIFDPTTANIERNTTLFDVRETETDRMTAFEVVRDVVAIGFPSSVRAIFGVYFDQDSGLPYWDYRQIPDTIDYASELGGSQPQVKEYLAGALVLPWNVLPGRWLFYPDFLAGRVAPGVPIRFDPRNQFLESVTYTAPAMLTLEGAKVKRTDQLLNRLGIGGSAT